MGLAILLVEEHRLLHTYLADGSGNTIGREAFRALQRGFNRWSCGRLDHMEVTVQHSQFCHVRCKMTPSMKAGVYIINLPCRELVAIQYAVCDCAAGYTYSWWQYSMQCVTVQQGIHTAGGNTVCSV